MPVLMSGTVKLIVKDVVRKKLGLMKEKMLKQLIKLGLSREVAETLVEYCAHTGFGLLNWVTYSQTMIGKEQKATANRL